MLYIFTRNSGPKTLLCWKYTFLEKRWLERLGYSFFTPFVALLLFLNVYSTQVVQYRDSSRLVNCPVVIWIFVKSISKGISDKCLAYSCSLRYRSIFLKIFIRPLIIISNNFTINWKVITLRVIISQNR